MTEHAGLGSVAPQFLQPAAANAKAWMGAFRLNIRPNPDQVGVAGAFQVEGTEVKTCQILADRSQVARVMGRTDSRIHLFDLRLSHRVERVSRRRLTHESQVRPPCAPGRLGNPANNTMHRQFIVTIETKIGKRNLPITASLRSDCKSYIVFAFGAKTGAIFSYHGLH